MESFSSYIDHLILLLAARFEAPLEVSTDELLSTTTTDPWELVARSVQVSLSCGPLTAQERTHMRQLDPYHFTAAVCRERARYVQWKLSEKQRRSRADHRVARTAAATAAAAAATAPSSSPSRPAADVLETHSFDVTRDSLQRDVSALYALVRQSLPSTLDDDSESDDGSEEAVAVVEVRTAPTAVPLLASQVHEVFVRTPEERLRDEQVARARDEFLSQIQALQTVYYTKYHRWMEAPVDVLEPPAPAVLQTLTAASSRRSSQSAPTATAAAVSSIGSGAHLTAQHSDADDRAALLAALQSTGTGRPTPAAAPAPNVRQGTHPTIAAMRRQVHLQRPLRPSAVARDAQAGSAESASVSQQQQWHRESGVSTVVPTKATPLTTASAAADASMRHAADARPSTAAAVVVAAAKETAPPVSRRGRWQIVEYGDDGEEEEED